MTIDTSELRTVEHLNGQLMACCGTTLMTTVGLGLNVPREMRIFIGLTPPSANHSNFSRRNVSSKLLSSMLKRRVNNLSGSVFSYWVGLGTNQEPNCLTKRNAGCRVIYFASDLW